MTDDRPYVWPNPPRLDVDGVEWWATDPYPLWYRYEGEWGNIDSPRVAHKPVWPEIEKPPVREVKQVIVMRTDLGMRKGKMIAQGAHASISFLTHWARGNYPLTVPELAWINGAFTKICLRVDSEEELLRVHEAARVAGLQSALITDAGKTEFHGVRTNTCLAIGPNWSDEIDAVTGDLRLL